MSVLNGYCDLIVTPERRSAERLLEDQESSRPNRRVIPRYILSSNNPYGFFGLDDPDLSTFADLICTFQNGSRETHPEHAKDMAFLPIDRARRIIFEGGAHVFVHEKGMCIACFLIECLGSFGSHLVVKGGYLATRSRLEVFEFLDTLLLHPYQGCWVVIRTWDGLRSLFSRLLNGKHLYGPWLEYGYEEFSHKLPAIWNDYTYGGKKGDNGNPFLVRPPVGLDLSDDILPDSLSPEDTEWLKKRMQQQLFSTEIAALIRYYATIERAGRLGKYSVPDVRSLEYGDRI
ncbi:MAG: hypothetical protein UU48_C0006G0092 [Candidatus Uhrbacteria bacterium GW2011_GWF2_41_16]|uniref:Uncharacterized protein n=2 Tax=Candidatus Uhriibacteriota TaxID=1752732 RepID=A0A0G0YCK1_9BACT|nr:MAG: hypothetical protein UU35_C0007G0040 [Candidatus Uhrbacteria bacterium GW2011_GWC2_41_11]KKR98052.1 MAG: hypothetical protein UU48_C0006G0092 [Candidatus Uhrbacteria bacterium GW2011_GWF2_41_16]HBO99680.1 hypothetical protein [Candidatus Uhrbacteria bacterium]